MKLTEAKKILAAKGYLLKEYSPHDDTYSHKSEGWDETEKRFMAGVDLVKKKISTLGLEITSENISEPAPMNDTWNYTVKAKSDNNLSYYFSFYEARPERLKGKEDVKGEMYDYRYYISTNGAINKKLSSKNPFENSVDCAKEMINAIDSVVNIDTSGVITVVNKIKEELDPWTAKGYTVDVKTKESDYGYDNSYDTILDVIVQKKLSDKVKEYAYQGFFEQLLVYFSIDGNTLKWNISSVNRHSRENISIAEGSLDDMVNLIQKYILGKYNEMLKRMSSSKNRADTVKSDNSNKKMAQERLRAHIENLLETDLIGNFDKAVELDRNYVNSIIMKPVADEVNDYVFDNYSDENGHVGAWDDNNAWDYFDDDFVGFIEKNWNGSIKEYCDEYDITTLDELHNDVRENWDWDRPSESVVEYDPY